MGTGFLGTNLILGSQVQDRINRVNGSVQALTRYVIDALQSAQSDKGFPSCFPTEEYLEWYKRWEDYRLNLSWLDINFNTVGTWDQLDTYEREFEIWRGKAHNCGAQVPSTIEKPPESKTPTFLASGGVLLVGVAALLYVLSRRR